MELKAQRTAREAVKADEPGYERDELVRLLEQDMFKAAEGLEFEIAAALRDQIRRVKEMPAKAGEKVRMSDLSSDGHPASKAPRKAGMPGTRAKKKSKRQRGAGA